MGEASVAPRGSTGPARKVHRSCTRHPVECAVSITQGHGAVRKNGMRAAPTWIQMSSVHGQRAETGLQGPLSAYLNRIDQHPLLTPEEERRLALRWKRF